MDIGTASLPGLAGDIAASLVARNPVSRELFAREAAPLAAACRDMADRFARGGRLLAIGRRQSTSDAQHVAVEFVHPVIVGKRALPAANLSDAYGRIGALVSADDIVMGFGPPEGDREIASVLREAGERGAQTFALPGEDASYALAPFSDDPFIHQELVEILYHTLWETVHVYLEHRESGHEVGASEFLYPFLGRRTQDVSGVLGEVAASIQAKAREDERLRVEAAGMDAGIIARAVGAVRERLDDGGSLLAFGNGGSATDANDFALDCLMPPPGAAAIPAMSLASDPATVSAIANDIGKEAVFLRQLIALGRPRDTAVAFSTSGGSGNIIAALAEARKRGMLTLAIVGYDGGEIARRHLADLAIVVRSDYIPRIQELHASIYHVMIDALRGSVPARLADRNSVRPTQRRVGT